MNIRVVDDQDAQKLRSKITYTPWDEIRHAVDALEYGKAIVVEFDTEQEARRCANALCSARKFWLKQCYYSKNGKIIVIGKNQK